MEAHANDPSFGWAQVPEVRCDLGAFYRVQKDWESGALIEIRLKNWQDGRRFAFAFPEKGLAIDKRSVTNAELGSVQTLGK